MSNLQQTLLTPNQLIELEGICDAFERKLADGKPADIESVIDSAPTELRRSLRVELKAICEDFTQQSSIQTRTEDSMTISPDDFLFRSERIDKFQSSLREDNNSDNPPQNSFGRFQLHSIVGRGGSGVVWRAFDGNLNRWVALKIAHVNSIADSKRFVREAQAVAKLKHPNVIPVFEAGEIDGRCYLVSEFCEGQPLSQMLNGQPLDIEQSIKVVLAIIDGVAHSHAHGIVHRDIKPQNIMINADGCPMVTDFGLAKNLTHDQTLTLAGELIGTPSYMAPEQAKGGGNDCGEQTDIYSIGVVLFQLLTGKLPFTGGFERIVFQVINSVPPRLRTLNDELPVELEAICAKCLEKSPGHRFQSAQQLGDELRRFLEGKPVQTQNVTLAGRYFRWLKREPRVAWTTTVCTLLLLAAAIASTFTASLMTVAWRSEKRQATLANQALAAEVVARQEADQAKSRAEQAEQLAEQQAQATRAEANFLASIFAPIDMMGVNQVLAGNGRKAELLSVELIENANRQADHLLAEVPLARSRVKGMLANAWRSHGQLQNADAMLRESSRLLEENSDADDENLLGDRAMNQLYWAYLWHHRENFKQASESYQSAIKLFKQVVARNSTSPICQLQLAQAEFGMGALLLRQKKNAEAEVYIERVLNKRRELLQKGDSLLLATELAYLQCDPKNSLSQLPKALQSVDEDMAQKAMTLYWELVALRKAGQFKEATASYRQLLDLIRDEAGENNWLYTLAIGDFANLQREAGNFSLAFSFAQKAIRQSKEFDPWHPQRMNAMQVMAFELLLANRFEEAKTLLLEVAEHESPRWNDSIKLHSDLAWCHYHLGEYKLALNRSMHPLRVIGACTAWETAWHRYTHATMLAANNRQQEAKVLFDQAVASAEKMVQKSALPNQSTWLKRVGTILTFANRDPQAEQVYRRAAQFAEQEYFAGHPRYTDIQILLAKSLIQQKQLEKAKPVLEKALMHQSGCLPPDDARLKLTRKLLSDLQ